jgi:hypothetical protein
MKQAYLRDMFKKVSKSVCISTVVVSPDPLSPTPSTSSAMKTPENREEDPTPLNQQLKEISKWNIPLMSCTAQV